MTAFSAKMASPDPPHTHEQTTQATCTKAQRACAATAATAALGAALRAALQVQAAEQ